jgi:hypothetical protein
MQEQQQQQEQLQRQQLKQQQFQPNLPRQKKRNGWIIYSGGNFGHYVQDKLHSEGPAFIEISQGKVLFYKEHKEFLVQTNITNKPNKTEIFNKIDTNKYVNAINSSDIITEHKNKKIVDVLKAAIVYHQDDEKKKIKIIDDVNYKLFDQQISVDNKKDFESFIKKVKDYFENTINFSSTCYIDRNSYSLFYYHDFYLHNSFDASLNINLEDEKYYFEYYKNEYNGSDSLNPVKIRSYHLFGKQLNIDDNYGSEHIQEFVEDLRNTIKIL